MRFEHSTQVRCRVLSVIVTLACCHVIVGQTDRPASAPAGDAVSASDRSDRERARDRVVSIEAEIVRDIPQVPRLCDSLDSLVKRRVNVGDCELYCEEAGAGRPLVLISGGPGATHHEFHPAFGRAESFARVIYYDQRGCGLSDHEAGDGYTVDQAVNDLDRLRRALGIDRWIVLGHSYGGLLAQCYTIRYPEQVAGLVLVGSSTAMWGSLEPGRERQFLSREELDRIKAINKTPGLTTAQRVYNNFLNGDWKRQSYYRPTREEIARMALYEWSPGPGFRNAMNESVRKVDLGGAFADCPIPTLIVEGEWDLTWNTDKPGALRGNHRGARLVMFAQSAHSPFVDEPEKFFALLRDFARELPEVTPIDLKHWKEHLARWKEAQEKSPAHILAAIGWGGFRTSERIAEAYSEEWLEKLDGFFPSLQTGCALFDVKRYEDALAVFRRMEQVGVAEEDNSTLAIALVWQGHMLDLLGRRDEAIAAYRRVVGLKLDPGEGYPMRHDQYGLAYYPKCYALERTKVPFTRLENIWDELIAEP